MRIAHISDFHLRRHLPGTSTASKRTSRQTPDLLPEALARIEQMSPDLVVVTGDLVDYPLYALHDPETIALGEKDLRMVRELFVDGFRPVRTALLLALPFVALFLLVSVDVTRHVLAAAAPSERDVSREAFPPNLGITLRSLSDLADAKLPRLLAAHLPLAEMRGPHAGIRDYLVPPVLSLAFDRPRLESLFANRARVALPPGGTAVGFWQAIPACFAIRPRDLTAGEAAVLCRLSMAPTSPPPDSLLLYRQISLDMLKAAGALSPAAFEVESERPLALAPDHMPIW